jgi:UDP-glucose:glycoprotein glucosyltransferase
VLQFDRVLGNHTAPASILYVDITSPAFGHFHKNLVKTTREGKTSYRVRHRKSSATVERPLIIPGYGIELALKRTDYIVIDDREDDSKTASAPIKKEEVKFEDEEVADLKPLSTSELFSLGIKASSFIMESDNPLDTLVKLSQDFPKYSSAIASHNATKVFVDEHEYNRAQLVPAGMNILWMNGVQLIERQIEALDLLDLLRKERKLISNVQDLGLTALEAIQLLSHDEVATSKADGEVQRFDWRDDIEKDKRYEGWPTALTAVSRLAKCAPYLLIK